MTITDKQYNDISEKVYWLDPKHPQYNKSYKEGAIKNFGGIDFQILKIKENSSSNGMQAMAVAPIVHGKVDNKNFKTKKFLQTFAYLNNEDIHMYIKRKEACPCPKK
ncbi:MULTISPECIES: hypothetical protein [unclassified Enterococcus]|uniref:hypothetical protein n=1 Tax=unclassified Enterococcus TaxID=2608891 RepID=UPI0013EC3A29|nr:MULTISPECIES: hypothetical protein [unclassified Enterococcus]